MSRTVRPHPRRTEGVHILPAMSSQDMVAHVRGYMASQRVHGLRHHTAHCPPETRSAERVTSSRSAGLMTPRPPRWRTWVYIMVVLTSLCPSHSCTVRMSYPASRRWVVKISYTLIQLSHVSQTRASAKQPCHRTGKPRQQGGGQDVLGEQRRDQSQHRLVAPVDLELL